MAVNKQRLLRDSGLSVTQALPAAAANNNSPTIDLGKGPFHPEEMDIEIAIPALPNLADAHSVTIQLQDSADNSSFANVDPAISTTVTGASGAGSAAKTVVFRLPPGVRQYIQFYQAVASGGGDSTASSVTYTPLF